jgi:hypothetical protein
LASAKGVKMIASIHNVLQGWDRTPRAWFVGNEVKVSVCNTDPPIRGVLFHLPTPTSFLSSKVRRVLHHAASPFQSAQLKHTSQRIAKEAS